MTCDCRSTTSSKRVRFSQKNAVQEIEHAEKRDKWYSSQEMAFFQETAIVVCRGLENMSVAEANESKLTDNQLSTIETHLEPEDETIRGLEAVADPLLSRFRKRQRKRVIQSVLIAQATARHHREDLVDVERFIAHFSKKESAGSQKVAEMMGKADERSAIQIVSIQHAAVRRSTW